jgi:predicted DNA binding CopG/RHH family protein
MKKIKLDKYEQSVEKNAKNLVPVSVKKRKRIENNIEKIKKNRSISLRISNFDLQKLKEKAIQNGIPYQTLINNVLHKYVMNKFYEKDEVIKTLKIINKNS